MSFIKELKRRNVPRMAVLYVVAAWLIMQVAGVLIDLTALSAWSGRWVLAVLAIGFPIALLFSWFYEITPEGLALETEITPGQPITQVTGRRMDFVIISVLCAALILFAWEKWWPDGPIEQSIAVLPFENMSNDPQQEYFSDGISEEILNLLAQIGPLKVIARTSSFSFKGKDVDIATVAAQLNVRHILEGSVRRDGNQVRITAQLIDAQDSTHVWSQTFDRDLSAANLFHTQSEIARAIAGHLKTTLTEGEDQRLAKVPTDNMDAYAAYLLGRHRLTDRRVEGLAEATEQFALAIEQDPEFAAAYSGLADACGLYTNYSGGFVHAGCPPHEAENYFQDLEPLARKALELDDTLGEAWISLGELLDGQFVGTAEGMPLLREARAAFEQGLALNPSYSQGYHWYALSLDRVQAYENPPYGWLEAWKQRKWQSVIERGLEVDPLSVPLHYMAAIYPEYAQSMDDAMWHARRMIEIAPDSPRGYETLGELNWALLGRIDEAIKWESKAAEIDPQQVNFPMAIGRGYAALGDLDMALVHFERARQIISPQAKHQQVIILISEAAAWLGSADELSVQKARERLEKVEVFKKWQKLQIEASLALAAGRAAEWMADYEQLEPNCLTVRTLEEREEQLVYWRQIAAICPGYVARVFQELGDHERARDSIQKSFEFWEPWVDFAGAEERRIRTLAMLGREEEALDVFEELVQSGWRESWDRRTVGLRFLLHRDVTLDAIRDHPRFQAIVATIEADMAEQLENVREMERRGEIPTLEELRAALSEN